MIETIARSVQLAGACATDSGIERKVAAPTQAYVYLIERVSQKPEESERESEGAKEMEREGKKERGMRIQIKAEKKEKARGKICEADVREKEAQIADEGAGAVGEGEGEERVKRGEGG